MPDININNLSGIYKKIAELCDFGDKYGVLVETGIYDEVSIFNKAKKEYEETGSFSINGTKYNTSEGEITNFEFDISSLLNQEDNSDFPKISSIIPDYTVDLGRYYAERDKTAVRNPAFEVQKLYMKYNAELGNKLSNAAKKENIGHHIGRCKEYVGKILTRAGAGQLEQGSAYTVIGQLRGDNPEAAKHWKEVPHKDINPDYLPDVVLVCFDKDDNAVKNWKPKKGDHPKRPDGYHAVHGHVEVCVRNPKTGKFEGFSDGITMNVKFATADAIFIPV